MNLNGKRWKTPRRTTTIALLAAATAAACSESATEPAFEVPVFGFGNGAPSGAHYNLNWIGVPRNKTADMTGDNGHRIFFPLSGSAKVMLCESGLTPAAQLSLPTGLVTCPSDPIFLVLDANATDGTGAFALPHPEGPADTRVAGTTVYSVYVRALGKPGGSATNTTCGYALDDVNQEFPICSVIQVVLNRDNKSTGGTTGKSTFKNVTKCMLYVYADVNGDGTQDRLPLFDSRLQGYFWDYDNTGLKLAAFRFYPVSTTVPGTVTPVVDNC